MDSKMQILKFDRETISTEFSDCQNLGEVIGKLERIQWQLGHVICEVHVNGMFLNEQDENRLSPTNTAEIDTLEVKTRPPEELIKETVDSVYIWLPKVKEASLKVADELRQGRVAEGLRRMKDIFDGCHWLSDALGLLKSVLFVESQSLTGASLTAWTECELSFSNTVKEIMEAFEGRDYVLLADVLEYELSNTLDKWLELFNKEDKITNIRGEEDEDLQH